jgi:hypothetical protein
MSAVWLVHLRRRWAETRILVTSCRRPKNFAAACTCCVSPAAALVIKATQHAVSTTTARMPSWQICCNLLNAQAWMAGWDRTKFCKCTAGCVQLCCNKQAETRVNEVATHTQSKQVTLLQKAAVLIQRLRQRLIAVTRNLQLQQLVYREGTWVVGC